MQNFLIVSYGNKFIHSQFIRHNMTANEYTLRNKYNLFFIYWKVYIVVPFLKQLLCLNVNNHVRYSLSSYLSLGLVRLNSVRLCFVSCLLPSSSLEKILHPATCKVTCSTPLAFGECIAISNANQSESN